MPTYLSVPKGGAYIVGDRVLPDFFWPKLGKRFSGFGADASGDDYISKTTPDGRWTYGVGSYDKKLADVVGAMTPLESSIADLLVPGYGALKTIIANSVAVPTWYIWARSAIDGMKRIAGEWTLGHGGRLARDSYFTLFEAAFLEDATNDQQRVTIIESAKTAPGTFAWSNVPVAVAAMAKADVAAEAKKEAEEAAKAGATSVIVTAAVIGLVGWWLLKKI